MINIETDKEFLEIGPESNFHVDYKCKYDDQWITIGRSEKTKIDIQHDLNLGLPFADDTFSHVYSSHVIEHLDDPSSFVAECFRVLTPAGWCRVVAPNAKYYIKEYMEGRIGVDKMLDQFRNMRPRKHRHAIDAEYLSRIFRNRGFVDVRARGNGKSRVGMFRDPYFNARMRGDRSVCVEGRKP